jgi:fluoride exporter
MTTELDANPIFPKDGQPDQNHNIPVTEIGNDYQEESTTDTGFSTPSRTLKNSNELASHSPRSLLLRARTTGDYLQHVHDESRRRFLIANGGPLAARQVPISEDYGLDELRAPPILPDRERRRSLEQVWSHKTPPSPKPFRQRLRDDLIVASWIIVLSIWGALARIGLSALSTYPGQPVFQLIWAQFVGCAVMGFLLQDKTLFPKDKRYVALYIGLTTGFCGSLTSFSSFMWNCFQALANLDPYFERAGGDNVLALIGQVVITLSISIAALRLGAHAAQLTRHLLPSITEMNKAKRYLDSLGVILAVGSWSGAAIMTGLLPQWHPELLTTVFAPAGKFRTLNLLNLGALCRWQLSRYNPVVPSFPLGTFSANMLATVILGGCNLIQGRVRTPISMVSCAVLYGIDNGFCGCLSTVSTFAVELDTLTRSHAYIYAGVSIALGIVILVFVVGISAWTQGYVPLCGL